MECPDPPDLLVIGRSDLSLLCICYFVLYKTGTGMWGNENAPLAF